MGVCDGPQLHGLVVQLVRHALLGNHYQVRMMFHDKKLIYPIRVIALKVVLDQTLLTGPLLLAFFPFMSWCEGKENIFAELKEKLLVTYMVKNMTQLFKLIGIIPG